jgi:hypothetical protein
VRRPPAPPHYLDSGHFVGAANLMAKEGLEPEDAYERIVTAAARQHGLVDDDDFHHAFGEGASDEVQRGPAPADVAPSAGEGVNAQGGATAGHAQAGARVPGFGQAGGGDASAQALGLADRGREAAPLVRVVAEGEDAAQPLARNGGSIANAGSGPLNVTRDGEGVGAAGDPGTRNGRQASYEPERIRFDHALRLLEKYPDATFVAGSGYSTWVLHGNIREIIEEGEVTGYLVTEGQILTARAERAADPTLTKITEDSAAYVNKKTGAVSRVERI